MPFSSGQLSDTRCSSLEDGTCIMIMIIIISESPSWDEMQLHVPFVSKLLPKLIHCACICSINIRNTCLLHEMSVSKCFSSLSFLLFGTRTERFGFCLFSAWRGWGDTLMVLCHSFTMQNTMQKRSEGREGWHACMQSQNRGSEWKTGIGSDYWEPDLLRRIRRQKKDDF